MSSFKIPDDPLTIEKVMAAIREQIVRQPRGPATHVSLREALAVLARRQITKPEYRIQSDRPGVGYVIDALKRVIHWAASPYTDAVRGRQEAWNAATVQALGQLIDRLDAIDKRCAPLNERCARLEARVLKMERRDSAPELYAELDPAKGLDAMDENRASRDL